MKEEDINKNLRRGGEYFVLSIWIQSQMIDLIIFFDHPRIIKRFISRPQIIPRTLKEKRMKYWQKDFGYIKKEFIKRFRNNITVQAQKDLDIVYSIRNAIGHSHVSFARNYFLYRPGSKKKLNEFKMIFTVVNSPANASRPIVYKIDFSNDKIYLHNFASIQRMDEIHLKFIADSLRVPHSRIR